MIFRTRLGYIIAFFLLSLVAWHGLDGFMVREYVVMLLFLFGVQVFLNDILELYLIYGFRMKRRLFNLVIAPGTIVHEISHLFAVVLSGATLVEASLFTFNPQRGVLGYVDYSQPRDKWSAIRDLLIGFSPFFGCGLILLVLDALQGNSTLIFHDVEFSSVGSILSLLQDFWQAFFKVSAPVALLALYLKFCMALGSAPSSHDIKNVLHSLVSHPLSSLFSIILLLAVFFLSESDIVLGYYPLSGVISAVLRGLVVILLASNVVLLVSLPVVFVSVKLSELRMLERVIVLGVPIILYLANLRAEYVRSETVIAFSLTAMVAFWLLFKFKRFFLKD
ncbi:MAG: hypothetical protein V1921_07060 [Candidatus Altiarchaeota archaeon]